MSTKLFRSNYTIIDERLAFKIPPKNFIQLFYEQARNNPDHLIVVTADRTLSYDELNKKSDNLASHLKKQGIKAEDLVGLCASLSTDFVVCLLGILKAGAAYFPLDPTYPPERLKYMLADGKPAVVLVEPQFVHLLKNKKIIKIKENIFSEMNSPKFSLKNIDPQSLAYLVYTSGSTGKPKGIMVTYKSLTNIGLGHNAYYPSNLRMLISGGVCFDASLLVIFHALVNGDSLYLYNYSPKDNIDGLFNFIKTYSISYMISVPSQYLKLLQRNQILPSLKCVSLTGENLPKSLVNLHSKLAPNAILYNEYGPTEYAIGTTIAKIYNPIDRNIKEITVGKALPNTQVYVLDENLKIVPKGSKGEICIGGIGLARGYLNKESLTLEKFVWVTVRGRKPMRLYRTGDLGRILPNGELEFLGRIDNVAHISGNKVNLGEIEYHIARCPDIKESAVVIQPDAQGDERLIAYVTSSKKVSHKNYLSQYLKGLLPKHMIPSIIQIDNFPFSPNGKIDRDKLISLYG